MGQYVSRRIGRSGRSKYGFPQFITPRSTSIATYAISRRHRSPPALERRFFEIDVDGYCTVPVDWRRQKPKPRSLRCGRARATSNPIGRVGHCGWPAPSAGHKSTNAKTVPTKYPSSPGSGFG